MPAAGVIGRLRRPVQCDRARARRNGTGTAGPSRGGAVSGGSRVGCIGWVAQRIVEQRLLWNLRNHTEVVAAHPQDMTFEQVLAFIRRHSAARSRPSPPVDDHRRHSLCPDLRRPRPVLSARAGNRQHLPALYFGFRAIGHWLSMHGAAQGLHRVAWSGRSCPPLSELRDVVLLEPPARDARIHDVAARLRLPHLSTFFERVAVRHA